MSDCPQRERQAYSFFERGPELTRLTPPRGFHLVEVGSIVLCVAFGLLLAWKLALAAIAEPPGPMALAAAAAVIVAGYLAADLLSGLVHFLGDSFGTVDTPWLGRTFVLPFRSHHGDPQEICEHGFVETNGNNAFATLLVLVPSALLLPLRASGGVRLLGLFVLVLSIALFSTNQIHKWAHLKSPPRIVRALQRARILLSPQAHRAHHEPPHGRGYCVTSGLCNPVLDRFGFFPWLERTIRRVFRLDPRSP